MKNPSLILSEDSEKTQQNSEKIFNFDGKDYTESELKKLSYSELVDLNLKLTSYFTELNKQKASLISSVEDPRKLSVTKRLCEINNQKKKVSDFNTVISRLITSKKERVIDDFFFFFYKNVKKNISKELFEKILKDTLSIVPIPCEVKSRLRINL